MSDVIRNIIQSLLKLLEHFLVALVKVYQAVLSPYLGRQCRYEPTCSNYMIGALREWGPFKGMWLGSKRIGRCHPWGDSGYDPVPTNPKRVIPTKESEDL